MDAADSTSPVEPSPDPYRGVIVVLTAGALVATAVTIFGAFALGNSVLLHTAVSLGLSAGVLIGVAIAQANRSTPARATLVEAAAADVGTPEPGSIPEPGSVASDEPSHGRPNARRTTGLAVSLSTLVAAMRKWRLQTGAAQNLYLLIGGIGGVGIVVAQLLGPTPSYQPTLVTAAIGVVTCLVAAGLASTAVRYLDQIDERDLPESAALARGARVMAWILVIAATSVGLQWVGLLDWLSVLSFAIGIINVTGCYELLATSGPQVEHPERFDADFGVTRTLGSRANLLGSVLDAAQAQLGIDLRSTWALTVVRQSVEPLVIGLALVGWLSTAFTVVGIDEEGLVERLGVPSGGTPLSPGIHLHLPWPVDHVFRIPVRRVQVLTVGHEGEEEGGPEDVLWAREHAKNEYTLLLGNGRDLITVDAAVQFRIVDARAWHYRSQNPADTLRAIAYRAVMRTTVNKTLAEALSENLVATTARMRTMVQQEADALGIGVQVLGFTVGGMHPPVMVAADYQAVVSAELGKVTAVVNAQAERNRIVPYAESEALKGANNARAEGADALARAAGEAWSFLALESQYRTAPTEYFFRRRLETFERTLPLRRFTVVDVRFQRDGGELWITP